MCGITGIYHFDPSREVDPKVLKKMTDSLIHRGPDGEGFYINQNIGLGHRRLSIIDLKTGDQPMFNANKTIVVILNGEIYNYIELREELQSKGHRFYTTSDTEVIIKAYEEWGLSFQNKLNGMWAFALWDDTLKQLLISRDRIGEKPLHYALSDNSLFFGSEIKSIFEVGLAKEPRPDLVELYLVLKNIPAPFTFFKNIKKLLPGHYIIAGRNGIRENKYWEFPIFDENDTYRDEAFILNEFERLLQDSVKIRMRSDVPFGAFLSGGLDSSSIVYLMSGISPHPVKTFTIGYDQSAFDESQLARVVAAKFQTEHFTGFVEPEKFDQILAHNAFHFDEPFGDSSAIPTGYVSKFAAEKVKMVLTGDGGDEVLSGYPSYQGIKLDDQYRKISKPIRQLTKVVLGAMLKIAQGKIRYKLNRVANFIDSADHGFLHRNILKRAKPDLKLIKKLTNHIQDKISIEDYFSDVMVKCPFKDDFYKLMYLNFIHDLPNDYLVKVDRMSMAYSLETRVPFLDYRLIEFMTRVDKNIKMKGYERKSVLRNTIGKRLPPILLKSSKKGFMVPVREWFKEPDFNSRCGQFLGITDILDYASVQKIFDDNYQGKEDNGNLIWSLLTLKEVLVKSRE
jgi:asparagine synthase (glutamine-hydrolysing)